MTQLPIHDITRASMGVLSQNPPHALLISGGQGVGVYEIAIELATMINARPDGVQMIAPDEKGLISIESVRQLYTQTRSKLEHKTVFIIDQIDSMQTAAQNAFLKLLEEPNAQIVFILTTTNIGGLLPTILSRVQILEAKKISRTHSDEYLQQLGVHDSSVRAQLLFIASGRAAELHKLATDPEHRLKTLGQAADAKKLISAPRYDQLLLAQQYGSKHRNEAIELIDLSLTMCESMLARDASDDMLARAECLMGIRTKLVANGHIRTQLMRAVS